MLSFFKSQQPPVVFAFIILFFLIKIPFFAQDIVPVESVPNLWFSTGMIVAKPQWLNILIAQLCLLIQSIWINYLFHKADYHDGSSMVPALYFTLLSAVLPQFNVFSVYTLIVFLILMLFQVFLSITIKESTRLECFNAGILGGLLCVLNLNFVVFLPFMFLILYALKPFRFNEYLMLLFGMLLPFYFALSYSYLADVFINIGAFSFLIFYKNPFPDTIIDKIVIIFSAVYLLFSFISLRGIMYSTGFKRRKNINMLVFSFIGLTITVFFYGNSDSAVYSFLLFPISIFMTLFMLRIRKKRLGEILNVIFVLVIFVTNIVRIFK